MSDGTRSLGPKPIRVIESNSPDVIPLNGLMYVPAVIFNWRRSRFEAVTELLEPHATPERRRELRIASDIAAQSAQTSLPAEGVKVLDERVQSLARLLGRQRFLEIYDDSAPDEIIDFMLAESARRKSGEKGAMLVALSDITIEVLRGRRLWDERFDEAGAPTPEDITPHLETQQTFGIGF